ncbi:ABC transporter substrate-binding protein [Microbacterium sp. MYb66]|uniref:ABC transporter substrate-binding protein n=1 Tax=Microbacterium sp. MYb66 TaxID=1848692 RepID=UPI0011AFE3F5|nr:ABC transporter substrate-binding protein [Microbacterium sp. MYb66]
MVHSSRSSRRMLALGTAVVVAGALAGCTSSEVSGGGGGGAETEEGGTLLYSGFGGSYEESIRAAVFDPFSEETGIEILYDTDGSNVAKLAETIAAGATTPDLVDTESRTLAQFMAGDLLQPLDMDELDVSDVASQDTINEYSVPWYQFSRNLFWNADAFPDGGPETWAEVWDVEKYPGTRSFPTYPTGVLEVALLADGVAVDDLYPLDIDRAFAKLEEIKPNALFGGQEDVAIAQGEVVAGLYTLGRIRDIQSGGANIEYSWNGAVVSVQSLTIPKNAANPDQAYEAIQFALEPDQQRAVLDALKYTPSVTTVLDELTAEERADLPGTPETNEVSFYIDGDWYAENWDEVSARWQEFVNS